MVLTSPSRAGQGPSQFEGLAELGEALKAVGGGPV